MDRVDLSALGIQNSPHIYRNLPVPALVEHALKRGEGQLANNGALVVETGVYTGRAAAHKFIVDSPAVHDLISWGKVNQPVDREIFDALFERVAAYLDEREVFVFDGFAGSDSAYAQRFRVVNELASQNLFIRQLLRRPAEEQLQDFAPDYTILAAPGFVCDPARDNVAGDCAIMIDYEAHKVLIAGTGYAGEIKKSVFSIMNFLLPQQGVLPMHCSASKGKDGSTAVFFGLSGTGKTTLSADPNRTLIGDDEHGWADESVFNFEGGCYAKCINLSEESEPEIFRAVRFGTLLENVVMDPETRELDYDDDSLAVNSRAGYPLEYIDGADPEGLGNPPSTVIFLTADAFGVLPPISRLTVDQALYYFVQGFTSKVAGTELGITEPVPTFSTCFGEPFLPMSPAVYAQMLKERLEKTGAQVYLVNTGWNGTGQRTKLRHTRAMVNAALDGTLEGAEYVQEPFFGLQVPLTCPGCPDDILQPSSTWEDQEAFEETARRLAGMFHQNFQQKYADLPESIAQAGPLV